MDVAFDTLELRELCENYSSAVSKFGPENAVMLRARLADLKAAEIVSELQFCTECQLDQCSSQRIEIAAGLSLEFVSNHRHHLGQSSVDWSHVRRVRIVSIAANMEQL